MTLRGGVTGGSWVLAHLENPESMAYPSCLGQTVTVVHSYGLRSSVRVAASGAEIADRVERHLGELDVACRRSGPS